MSDIDVILLASAHAIGLGKPGESFGSLKVRIGDALVKAADAELKAAGFAPSNTDLPVFFQGHEIGPLGDRARVVFTRHGTATTKAKETGDG